MGGAPCGTEGDLQGCLQWASPVFLSWLGGGLTSHVSSWRLLGTRRHRAPQLMRLGPQGAKRSSFPFWKGKQQTAELGQVALGTPVPPRLGRHTRLCWDLITWLF